ncbi:MAG TPA: SDR family oxidoreductase [Candidatus Omnitrophota bacterium]|nr:SDR family oxidoreductase [Candidatus Omnitrophota bacterium]HQO59208.1 SDR family oxidoreductase [Candidatus Omnitrophota bacterium]HQP12721.1 SDR family oxidoreductase [Candidatus Omnitrophota bacterium]
MDLQLEDKVAVISGGTHGIGRAIALSLAGEGCRVAVCSRTPERVTAMEKELKERRADFLCQPADVTRQEDIARFMDAVIQRWGTVHILVNNVGGGGRWGREIYEETEESVWREVYEKNVVSAIRLTRMAIPFMRQQKWGRVVTITSIYGRESGGRPWFCMAKSAQTSFMKAMAKSCSLAQDGITFNSIAPGAIMIPGTGWEKEQKEKARETEDFIQRELPLGRFGTPEEVASVVTFVCSGPASLLNGASVPVDGGQGKSMI